MKNKKENSKIKLLDHFIQRSIAEEMAGIDEEAIARAIQTLLQTEDETSENIH